MKHEILIYNKTKHRVPEKFIISVISKALQFLKLKQPVELAVLVLGQAEIRKLNKVWRKKNEVPDELSFGFNSRQMAVFAKSFPSVLNLGEIIINAEKISDKNYLSKILIHSLLHLLDYNHGQKMEHLEKNISKYLNTKY